MNSSLLRNAWTQCARRATAITAASAWLATAALLAACGGGDADRLTVSGAVEQPRTYTLAELTAQPSTTQVVQYTAGGASQTHTYVGTPLQALVDEAVIAQDADAKNDYLNHYVVVTGTDGYRAVFSEGELRSDFRNRPSLVVHTESINGAKSILGADGFARVTAPGDGKGGRYVSNVASIEVRASGAQRVAGGSGPSAALTVSGAVTSAASFDRAALLALPQETRVIDGVAYSGPSLWHC